jgi:transcription elongation factor GreB
LERGATVEQFRLVGVDEVDLDQNYISWLSPLAKALLGKRIGERVQFRSPLGIEDIAILEVSYP